MAWKQAYSSRYLSVDPARRRFRVSRRAFSDPEVFRLEKERILYRSWQYLGHESEVRKPGDFVARQILDKNLIFVRDRERLGHRIVRMKSPAAHVEYPRSRTRHLYTSVRVTEDDGTKLTAWLNFHTFRNRNRLTVSHMGCTRYELQLSDANPHGLQIIAKRVMLDMDALIPQAKVSMFL